MRRLVRRRGRAGSGDGDELTLVAYSTPREAYAELTEMFAETPEGEGVSFNESYGSSGEQSRAVETGLDADVVAFSLAPDLDRLVEAGLVAADWSQDEFDGMVTDSVVVLAVRKGNPENIRGWDDLVREGVEVITPNPFTSGGARWNVMAAYGAKLKTGSSHEEAVEFLRRLFAQRDRAGQERARVAADVRRRQGRRPDRVRERGDPGAGEGPGSRLRDPRPDDPDREPGRGDEGRAAPRRPTFSRTCGRRRPSACSARTATGRSSRALRPSSTFPSPPTLFTIEDVGGWDEVQERFFDREEGIFAEIQRELGESTD